MANIKSLSLFILLLSVFFSCSTPFKQGKKNYDQAKYNNAIGHFKEALAKSNSKALVNKYIGESYRLSNRLVDAEPFYEAALNANSSDDKVRFYYAQALKANGKYDEAKKRFELYSKTGGNTDLIRLAKAELKNFDKIRELLTKKTYYEVENLDNINTDGQEFAPVLFQDQFLYTASQKEGVYYGDGNQFSGLYVYEFSNKERFEGQARKFDPAIHLEGTNEGTPAFSKDGNFVIFARSSTGEKGESDESHLYISRRSESGWSEPEILPYPINISKKLYEEGGVEELNGSRGNYTSFTPTITPDGKRLYFASNRPGGYGGLDIWRADIRGTRITNVRNLGRTVNTPGNELFPYVSDEAVLYFASDGHPGIGQLDIFEAIRTKGRISIKNMGKPLNSEADDFAFVYDTDTTGYLSSNRQGGKGGDDIYRFTDITPDRKTVNYFLQINVVAFNPEDSTTKPFPEANVEVFTGTETDLGEKLYTLLTNQEGIAQTIPVQTKSDYLVSARGTPEYLVEKVEYTTRGKVIPHELLQEIPEYEIDTTLTLEVQLEKIVVSENITYEIEINFDFDSDVIRPDAARELDKFVIFLKDNPQIDIELGSHTDAVGTDLDNLDLSQRRAESSTQYLISQGIDSRRITAKGYGESNLKVDTQDAEEQNRRTEFKIINVRK